ncbi:MAG: MarR family winged helix-turn-helix transcriptional regulator [Erysipelotrichaceae bacterium]
MKDIERTLNRLFVDVFNTILYLEERHIKEDHINLTMGEIHLLENIGLSKEKTVGSVAKLHRVTLGTATVGIDKLVKKGYVLKAKDQKDKRIVRLTLTEAATEVLDAHTRFHQEMITNILLDLDLEAQEELCRSLENVVEYFHKKYD